MFLICLVMFLIRLLMFLFCLLMFLICVLAVSKWQGVTDIGSEQGETAGQLSCFTSFFISKGSTGVQNRRLSGFSDRKQVISVLLTVDPDVKKKKGTKLRSITFQSGEYSPALQPALDYTVHRGITGRIEDNIYHI